MIDDVEADEYIFVSHAIFQELGYQPPIKHPKLNRYIAVSHYAADKLEEFANILGLDINAEVFYNPLDLEPKEKVIRIVAASRLEDETKGGKRILNFIEALDRYCKLSNRHYIFEIFSDSTTEIDSINVIKMKPRVDVRPYIADADILVQLSNNMETFCYSINEALMYGLRVVTTPLTVLNELNIPEQAIITCDWDMSNVDEVVKRIFEENPIPFKYTPPEPRYEDILDLTKSNYEEEKNMKVEVRATSRYEENNIFDKELTEQAGVRVIPSAGQVWQTDIDRANMLADNGMVTIIGNVQEPEPAIEEYNDIEVIEEKLTPLEDLTKEQLFDIAKRLGLELPKKSTKVTLIEKITEKQNS